MSGKPLDKYTDTTTPVSTSIQGCGMVEVKHEVYYPDDLGQRIPAANVPYRLQIPHGGNIFGTTDANGVLSFEGTGEGTFFCEYEPTLHIEKDQILNEIRTALDELLKVERDETAKIIKQLDEQPWYADAADYGMAAVRGVWKGLVGIVEFVGTVLWGAAKGLYHASKDLNPLTAPETFKQDMAALKETYQELKEFKDEDLETYLMLANDEETWKVFTKFAEDYVDAQHSLEWTEGGGETVFAIILIIVTAGAGAAGAAGSAGSRLAQLGQKLSGPIKRLTDVLKRARAKKKVKDKTNQRVESTQNIRHNKPLSPEINQKYDKIADSSFPAGSAGAGKVWSKKARLKTANLPTTGKIRYIPPKGYKPTQPLPRGPQNGFLDKFGNEWVRGESRTKGQAFEWDVQLSNTGREKIGWLTRDGSHANISLDGRVTHK